MGYGNNVRRALVMVTQFSIEMLVPIFICSIVGRWIDSKFGTSWVFVAGFFIGAIAGGTNIFRYAKRIYTDKSGDVRNRDRAVPLKSNTDALQTDTQISDSVREAASGSVIRDKGN